MRLARLIVPTQSEGILELLDAAPDRPALQPAAETTSRERRDVPGAQWLQLPRRQPSPSLATRESSADPQILERGRNCTSGSRQRALPRIIGAFENREPPSRFWLLRRGCRKDESPRAPSTPELFRHVPPRRCPLHSSRTRRRH